MLEVQVRHEGRGEELGQGWVTGVVQSVGLSMLIA